MTQLPSPAPLFNDAHSLVYESSEITLSSAVPATAQMQLARMFRDPYLLEKTERTELIRELRQTVALQPKVSELRVLLGMALCVDLQVQPALEELREAVKIAPDNFLARLKFGELLMRLRICEQAAEETRTAANLAVNPVQSELARRQAASIRAMRQSGIERGGYGGLFSSLSRLLQKSVRAKRRTDLAAVNGATRPA